MLFIINLVDTRMPLALEKLLKSHVCKTTQNLAPPLHNLVRLAELSGILVDDRLLDLLAEVSPFNIETRYPDMLSPEPTREQAMEYLKRIEEVLKWLIQQSPA